VSGQVVRSESRSVEPMLCEKPLTALRRLHLYVINLRVSSEALVYAPFPREDFVCVAP
jgi:hypothetical protein